MMDNQLTKYDIDNLVDCVTIWESHSNLILQSHDAMRTMYTDPEQLAEFDAVTMDKRRELIKEIATKKDQAIILKYKLVKIKGGIEATQALDKLSKLGDIDESREQTGESG
jgi:hypothetical protein